MEIAVKQQTSRYPGGAALAVMIWHWLCAMPRKFVTDVVSEEPLPSAAPQLPPHLLVTVRIQQISRQLRRGTPRTRGRRAQ